MNPNILYVSNNQLIETKLKEYFNQQNISFTPYAYEQQKATAVPYLMIIEPFRIRENMYSIHEIWKSYFTINQEKYVKLIVVDFYDYDCPNYLNLLKMPVDIHKWLASIHDLNQDWCIEQQQIGLNQNVIQPMTKFFKGHGPNSLFQNLNAWQFSVKNIHYTITGEIDRTYEEALKRVFPRAQKQWQEFRQRWRSYHIFFTCCPFALEKKKIISLLEQIEPYFLEDCPPAALFQSTKCLESLKQIRSQLTKMDRYVRPDKYKD